MLRYLFLLSLVFSLNAFSDVFLSSPKIKLNAQNQRVIEFRIENERINDGDITLNEYKTNNPIDESFIEYTLINDFGNYHTFTIVLDDEYLEDYFSFKILIKENFAKEILWQIVVCLHMIHSYPVLILLLFEKRYFQYH